MHGPSALFKPSLTWHFSNLGKEASYYFYYFLIHTLDNKGILPIIRKAEFLSLISSCWSKQCHLKVSGGIYFTLLTMLISLPCCSFKLLRVHTQMFCKVAHFEHKEGSKEEEQINLSHQKIFIEAHVPEEERLYAYNLIQYFFSNIWIMGFTEHLFDTNWTL